jgi:hypothetical protein
MSLLGGISVSIGSLNPTIIILFGPMPRFQMGYIIGTRANGHQSYPTHTVQASKDINTRYYLSDLPLSRRFKGPCTISLDSIFSETVLQDSLKFPTCTLFESIPKHCLSIDESQFDPLLLAICPILCEFQHWGITRGGQTSGLCIGDILKSADRLSLIYELLALFSLRLGHWYYCTCKVCGQDRGFFLAQFLQATFISLQGN